MAWNLQSDRPIYTQLVEEIQRRIVTGVYPAGSRLPAVRELAVEASVNPNTMQRALAKLEEDGLLYTQRTSGRFVTEDRTMIDSVKRSLAQRHIQAFWEAMTHLGYDREEVLALMRREMSEEGDNNGSSGM